jgi:hypothetical protein
MTKVYNTKVNRLRNQFYIKYYMIKAGNNNPNLKKNVNKILDKLAALRVSEYDGVLRTAMSI